MFFDGKLKSKINLPLIDDIEINGGLKSVNTYTELLNISSFYLKDGNLVWVKETKTYYIWKSDMNKFQIWNPIIINNVPNDGDTIVYKENNWISEKSINQIIEITYNELKNIKYDTTKIYKLIDYYTTSFIPYLNNTITNIEELLLFPITESRLNKEAIGINEDLIYYDLLNNSDNNIKGKIIKRESKNQNITPYDFKEQKFARWLYNNQPTFYFPIFMYQINNLEYPIELVSLNINNTTINLTNQICYNSIEIYEWLNLILDKSLLNIELEYDNQNLIISSYLTLTNLTIKLILSNEIINIQPSSSLAQIHTTFDELSFNCIIENNIINRWNYLVNNIVINNSYNIKIEKNCQNITLINCNNIHIDEGTTNLILINANNIYIKNSNVINIQNSNNLNIQNSNNLTLKNTNNTEIINCNNLFISSNSFIQIKNSNKLKLNNNLELNIINNSDLDLVNNKNLIINKKLNKKLFSIQNYENVNIENIRKKLNIKDNITIINNFNSLFFNSNTDFEYQEYYLYTDEVYNNHIYKLFNDNLNNKIKLWIDDNINLTFHSYKERTDNPSFNDFVLPNNLMNLTIKGSPFSYIELSYKNNNWFIIDYKTY